MPRAIGITATVSVSSIQSKLRRKGRLTFGVWAAPRERENATSLVLSSSDTPSPGYPGTVGKPEVSLKNSTAFRLWMSEGSADIVTTGLVHSVSPTPTTVKKKWHQVSFEAHRLSPLESVTSTLTGATTTPSVSASVAGMMTGHGPVVVWPFDSIVATADFLDTEPRGLQCFSDHPTGWYLLIGDLDDAHGSRLDDGDGPGGQRLLLLAGPRVGPRGQGQGVAVEGRAARASWGERSPRSEGEIRFDRVAAARRSRSVLVLRKGPILVLLGPEANRGRRIEDQRRVGGTAATAAGRCRRTTIPCCRRPVPPRDSPRSRRRCRTRRSSSGSLWMIGAHVVAGGSPRIAAREARSPRRRCRWSRRRCRTQPQLNGSESMSTQISVSGQYVWPGQIGSHMPFPQYSSYAHWLPHEPQLLTSFWRSSQTPLQMVRFGSEQAHSPWSQN